MEQNNKRIIKNTIYLYFRQFIIMALGFVSTRIVLQKLGVDDYGVYNVVGGFVALFSILNNVLQSATRRFLALTIGAADTEASKKTFSTALIIHIFIAIMVVVALETVGLWILNTKLNIPPDSLIPANWVFQFSVLTVAVTITQTPYTAVVTANERFIVYAFMSIFDIVAKIAVLFLLAWLPFNKLIVYAVLMFIVSFISCMIYRVYCVRHFPECRHLYMRIDKSLFKEMIKFSGWDSVGNITSIANVQGVTILLNIFFNTAVNTARGVATTATYTISQFVTGFTQAAEPQLVKYYAQNDKYRFERLIFNIAQMTLFMLAIIAVPVWMEIDFVLKLWLGIVPEYTTEFIKITIFSCFITYSNTILVKANVAMGRVKQLSLYIAPVAIIHLPIVYIVLRQGWSPTAVYWVGIIPAILRLFIDLYILRRYADFPAAKYFFNVFLKYIILVGVASIIPYFIRNQMVDGWQRFFIVCSISVICTFCVIWIFAVNQEVRQMILRKILGKYYKYIHNT